MHEDQVVRQASSSTERGTVGQGATGHPAGTPGGRKGVNGRRARWLAPFAALVLGAGGVSAAHPVAAASSCSTSGATVTCTYTSSGEQTFVVPAGVNSLQVTAIGGAGGNGYGGEFPGAGAQVTTTLAVAPGHTLYIEVGANGASSSTANGAAGGAGGGGAGGAGGGSQYGSAGGGGGGGATDIQTSSCTTSGTCVAHASATSLLVVAGGGGGSAGGGGGCAPGGNAGSGAPAPAAFCNSSSAYGGGGGTASAGGAGGQGYPADPGGAFGAGHAGSAGQYGLGGTGGNDASGDAGGSGGGGGSGYYGGGGGGGGHYGEGGGGGGSSYVTSSGTQTSIGIDTSGTPKVVIRYSVPTLTITADNTTMTYGGTVPALTASYGGFVNGDSPSSLTTAPTCTTTASSGSPAGSYPITCSGAADPNYNISYVGGTLTVNPASLTITASSPSMTYGGTVPAVTPSYSGFVNSDSADSLTTAPTCTTTATSGSAAGAYPTSCSGASDPNYSISYVNGTLTVNQAPLTITASSPFMTYGGPVPSVVPGYNGLVNGDKAPATPAVCTTAATSGSPVGTYSTTCSGAADLNYSISYVGGTLTVNPASLTITASSPSMTYGGTVPAVTPSYSGFVNSDSAGSLTTAPTCTTTATSGSAAGAYPTSCSGAADPNYSISYVNGTLTVNPATLTITASSPSMTYGGTVPAVTPSYSGFVNSDSAGSLTTAPTCTTSASSGSAAGAYPTSCSGAADPNYSISYVNGTLTVNPATLTITADKQTTPYGHVPTDTWTGTGWVNGESASVLTSAPNRAPTCSASVNGVADSTTTSPGVYPNAISCQGAIDPNYTITYVSGTLTVDPLLTLAESGLPSTVPHLATLDGHTVTLPDMNVELAYGSSHSYSFPATVIDHSGTVYITSDAGFSGVATANRSDTAAYQTMSQIVSAALASGGINNSGQVTALIQQFAAVQADIAAGNTTQALVDLHTFAAHVQAQTSKHIAAATAQLLLIDAQLVYASLGGTGTV